MQELVLLACTQPQVTHGHTLMMAIRGALHHCWGACVPWTAHRCVGRHATAHHRGAGALLKMHLGEKGDPVRIRDIHLHRGAHDDRIELAQEGNGAHVPVDNLLKAP